MTVDGYRGKHFEYSPGEEDDANCLLSDYKDVWILDVDGVLLMIGSRIGGDLDLDVPEEGSEGRDPADGGVDPLRTLTRHRVHRHTANRGRQG